MIIDAEYEEVEGGEAELDLSADDSLPWLEADEEDDDGGSDNTHIILLGLIFLGITVAAVGTVWFFGSKADEAMLAADGSVIEAPEGPIKERPEDPGGKEFAGTGTVAPVVAEGGTPEGVMNTDGDAADANEGAGSQSASADGASGAASGAASGSSASGVGVQLAAYSSRARAVQGWDEITRRTEALKGFRYRIEEGVVDIGTVYRLQAVAGSRAAADTLCANLKSDGIDCQVKG